MGFTTADLLTRAKLYGWSPASSGSVTDTEFLQLADDELQSYVFPRVLEAKGEYRVATSDASITAGQTVYRLPTRAHAGRLRDVLYIDTAGNAVSLPMMDPEELGTRFSSYALESMPRAWYFQDSNVVVWPAQSTTRGTLRRTYFMRPGTLVATSACAKITTIGAASSGGAGYRRFTCANVPTSVTTSVTVDMVRADGGFETSHIDMAVHAVVTGAAGTIDIAETALTVGNISVGDYISIAGEACIPQVPDICHPWLARRVATLFLETQQDDGAMKASVAAADRMEQRILETLTPRVDGEPKTIVPTFSPIRSLFW